MQPFVGISKFTLVALLVASLYGYFLDMGKAFMTYSQNDYIARNAASYMTNFGVEEKDLLEYDEKAVNINDVKDALLKYFDLQYENMGYERVEYGGSGIANNYFKAVYFPTGWNRDDHMWLGPIYVRAKLYGFDGAPASPVGGDGGFIVVNIEQKVPTSLRKLMKSFNVSLKTGENPVNGVDFEGFWGYYSIISEHAFSTSIVK